MTGAAEAYEHYLRVRTWAHTTSRVSAAHHTVLSDVERQTVEALGPLWDAAPETIAALRRWGAAISGTQPSDYERPSDQLVQQLRRERSVLQKRAGGAPFVPEPPLLGGFGYVRGGERYNADTLQYFEALIALQDAAILQEFNGGERRLVWEIGGGWGGFAYQFKTACPHVTYLITAVPELFLVSAVYLMTAFPAASCRFFDPAAPIAAWHEWQNADFIFAPEGALADAAPPPIELTLDVMTLGRMTAGRIAAHAQRAFDFESRYFYAMLPADETASSGVASPIRQAVERLYWPHVMPPRGEQGKPPVRRHLIGWRRMVV
jgi:hypothetical protein